jgi:polyphenol oxidase
MSEAPYIVSDALEAVPHGFFGREGGLSEGPFASLNASVAVGDDANMVDSNRRKACAQVARGRKLVLLKQVHSNRVVAVAKPNDRDVPIEADGLVTNHHGLLLGILTADCAPILLADTEAGVVGAAHAGWRGAVDDICYSVVVAMIGLGARAENIRAAIGPTISAANYEVGPDFVANVIEKHPQAGARIVRQVGGREHFDLPGFVSDQLRRAGVGHVADSHICTYADPAAYFSHRYATHHGTRTGRQISLIGLR